jgi:hypothetical protein
MELSAEGICDFRKKKETRVSDLMGDEEIDVVSQMLWVTGGIHPAWRNRRR